MARSNVFWIRKLHRYLGILIGIQLLLWTASGLYFSWNPITEVRGEHLRRDHGAFDLRGGEYAPAGAVIDALRDSAPQSIDEVPSVTLRSAMGAPVYEIQYRAGGRTRYAVADARTGALRPAMTEADAVAIARADFVPEAEVVSVTRIESVPADSEYRGRPLPAYRVVFEHPTATRIYVSAERWMVTARRNSTWRVFDFLWMLHIMDYDARDDINNVLLQVLSIMGAVTVMSGFVLWAVTSPLFRRRRRKRDVPVRPPTP